MNDADIKERNIHHRKKGTALINAVIFLPLIAAAPMARSAPLPGSDDYPRLALLVQDEKAPRRPRAESGTERDTASWSVAFDNDILVPGSRDQDYTYGLSASYTGAQAARFWFSLDRPLGLVDGLLGLGDQSPQGIVGHSVEAGLFGFTPEKVAQERIQPDDRPYASLVYLSSSRVQINNADNIAWHTTLTVGALGLPIVGDAQNQVHKMIGSHHAKGWDHQISEGGEPTARYEVARQHYLPVSSTNWEVKSTTSASVGYLTEARWDLSFRYGRIDSPWWRFNPDLARYGEGASNAGRSGNAPEHYLWGGIGIVARGYNAFLQGQFRHSDVTYAFDELHHGLLEAWLGYTFTFRNGYRVSYVLRGHTSEVRHGTGNRNVMWGGLVVAKTF